MKHLGMCFELASCCPSAGLTSAKDFEVRIEHDRFILRAEGRYNLVLLNTQKSVAAVVPAAFDLQMLCADAAPASTCGRDS